MPKSLASWTQEIEADLGRELAADEQRFLDRLSELLEELDWRETLYAKDLYGLSEDFKGAVADAQTPVNRNLWSQPPKDEYSLWQYIALIFRNHELELPAFLRSQTRVDELRRQIAERQLNKEARLWRNRLGNLSQRREESQVKGTDARLRLKGRALSWEISPAGKEDFQDLSAKQMGQWLDKPYGFLERFSSRSLPLCARFQEYYRSTQRSRLDLDKGEDCAFLNSLLHDPDTQGSIVGPSGEPLALQERALTWLGMEDLPSDDGYYRLRLAFGPGEPAPFPLTYLPGPTPLYLHGESLYHGPPLLQAEASPNSPFKIPAAALESPEGLLFLRNHGLPLPQRVRHKVIAVPLAPMLYGSVERNQSPAKRGLHLHLRLAAVSRDRAHWFLLTSDGWEPCPNLETQEPAPPPEEGMIFEYPSLDRYLKLLERLEASEDDEEPGLWRLEITHGFPTAFTEWLQECPGDMQIVADEELDSLVDQKPAGRYALDLETQADSDWFDIKLRPDMLDTTLSEEEQKLLLRSKGEHVYLPGKGWRRFEPSAPPSEEAILESLGLNAEQAASARHSLHALQLAEARLEGSRFETLARQIKRRAKSISAETPASLPKGIVTTLRPYQEEGFRFLAFLARNRFGGILADDMGLGKTLQCLTWLTWLKLRLPKEERFAALVVCPKSVMHVWKSEVAQHAKLLEIAAFDPATVNQTTWQVAQIDLLVANYSQLRIHRSFFASQPWTACVLDEGQYIKNPASQTAKAARSVKAQHRIVLTGTPVENKAADLWSLFAYAMPGLLGSLSTFKRLYSEKDESTTSRLSRRVKHFMLRRSKKQVAPDLPPRIEETLTCDMEGQQLELYQAELKSAQKQLLQIRDAGDFDAQRFNVLASLLRLRQICCHPQLLNPAYASIPSAKLDTLVEHVSELQEEGHKVLIFSQFVEMLGIISRSLQEAQCEHLMLTGQTQNREELVEQFQQDESKTAFLLSLRAAGFGLNLTAASYVFLYDPWWNPAVEAQAIDRTHRIGQQAAVNAYRLIAANSIEQRIQSLQVKKEHLANEIVREESLQQILDLGNLRYVLSQA